MASEPISSQRPASTGIAARTAPSGEDVGWLITLSDLSLLLLCFFIVLHVADRRRAALVLPEAGIEQVSTASPAESEQSSDAEQPAPAEELPAPLTISFAPGAADLRREMFPVLQQIVDVMQRQTALGLEIVGHTDDRPIATAEFPSNWELSAARASGVARYLIQRGIDPARLSVQGYAAFRPALPNFNVEGRGANRRVEMRFYHAGGGEDRPAAGTESGLVQSSR